MSSILTPYLTYAWSSKLEKSNVNTEVLLTENNENNERNDPNSIVMKDFLSLVKRLDVLEDEVSLRCAERDRARAQLEILRLRYEAEREDAFKQQVYLPNNS